MSKIILADLEIKEVEYILAALSAGEYKLVAALIDKIKLQAIPQAEKIMQEMADAEAQKLADSQNSEQNTEKTAESE